MTEQTYSKEITYLDQHVFGGYLDELADLVRTHEARLSKRQVGGAQADALEAHAQTLRAQTEKHAEAKGTTAAESAEAITARNGVNAYMVVVKEGATAATRRDPAAEKDVVRRALRIGQRFNPKRASFVLSEAKLVVAGAKKHRAKLLNKLTPDELDAGDALIAALEKAAFGRIGALNDQVAIAALKEGAWQAGRKAAEEVLDAVELEFSAAADSGIRNIFYGLDERLAAQFGTQKRTPKVAPPAGVPA